jgi:chitinase
LTIVDWEYPADQQQGQDFLSLLANIRLHLPEEKGYILTAALPAGQWALQHIDIRATDAYLDFINLMAYDFSGSHTPTAGHHAQLYPGGNGEPSGSTAVEYIRSTGFPVKKILLGIPVYGRSFLGATGPGDAYNGHGGDKGTFEYKELPRPGAEEMIDTVRVAASCIGGDGGFVSYDNPETVQTKGRYCKTEDLGVSKYPCHFILGG